jgi:hypothetical protein
METTERPYLIPEELPPTLRGWTTLWNPTGEDRTGQANGITFTIRAKETLELETEYAMILMRRWRRFGIVEVRRGENLVGKEIAALESLIATYRRTVAQFDKQNADLETAKQPRIAEDEAVARARRLLPIYEAHVAAIRGAKVEKETGDFAAQVAQNLGRPSAVEEPVALEDQDLDHLRQLASDLRCEVDPRANRKTLIAAIRRAQEAAGGVQ